MSQIRIPNSTLIFHRIVLAFFELRVFIFLFLFFFIIIFVCEKESRHLERILFLLFESFFVFSIHIFIYFLSLQYSCRNLIVCLFCIGFETLSTHRPTLQNASEPHMCIIHIFFFLTKTSSLYTKEILSLMKYDERALNMCNMQRQLGHHLQDMLLLKQN